MGSLIKLDPTQLKPFSLQQQMAHAFLYQNQTPQIYKNVEYPFPNVNSKSESISLQFNHGLIIFDETESSIVYSVINGEKVWNDLVHAQVDTQIGLLTVTRSGQITFEERPAKVTICFLNRKYPLSKYLSFCKKTAFALDEAKLNVYQHSEFSYECHRFINPMPVLSLKEYLNADPDMSLMQRLMLALKIVYAYSDMYVTKNKSHGDLKSKFIFIRKDNEQIIIMDSYNAINNEHKDFVALLEILNRVTHLKLACNSIIDLTQELLLNLYIQFINDCPNNKDEFNLWNDVINKFICLIDLKELDISFDNAIKKIQSIFNDNLGKLKLIPESQFSIRFLFTMFNMQSLKENASKDELIQTLNFYTNNLLNDLAKLNQVHARISILDEIFKNISHPSYFLIAKKLNAITLQLNNFFHLFSQTSFQFIHIDILSKNITNFLIFIQSEELSLMESFDDASLLFNNIIHSLLYFKDKKDDLRVSILNQLRSYIRHSFTDAAIKRGDLAASRRRKSDLETILNYVNDQSLSDHELRLEITKMMANMKGGFFLFSNSVLKSKVSSVLNKTSMQAENDLSALNLPNPSVIAS